MPQVTEDVQKTAAPLLVVKGCCQIMSERRVIVQFNPSLCLIILKTVPQNIPPNSEINHIFSVTHHRGKREDLPPTLNLRD